MIVRICISPTVCVSRVKFFIQTLANKPSLIVLRRKEDPEEAWGRLGGASLGGPPLGVLVCPEAAVGSHLPQPCGPERVPSPPALVSPSVKWGLKVARLPVTEAFYVNVLGTAAVAAALVWAGLVARCGRPGRSPLSPHSVPWLFCAPPRAGVSTVCDRFLSYHFHGDL